MSARAWRIFDSEVGIEVDEAKPRQSTATGKCDEIDPMQIGLTKLIRCRQSDEVAPMQIFLRLPTKPCKHHYE